MITIPRNTSTGIAIPVRATPPKSEPKPIEATPRMSVSIPKAAKILGIGKPRLLSLIKEGKIRSIRVGKRDIVSVQSLREFVDGTKGPSNPLEKSDKTQDEPPKKQQKEPPLAIPCGSGTMSVGKSAWVAERKEKT